jgi:acetyl esterase/lipase
MSAPAHALAQAPPVPSVTETYQVIDGDSLLAYVFLPDRQHTDTTSAILLFHGGGWAHGSADWTFATAQRFADWGLVAVAIEYRLSAGEITPIDAMSDACAAFAWIRARSASLGVNGRVAGYGVSAGGQLVAATATVGCHDSVASADALLLWSPALDLVNDGWFASLLQGRASAVELSPARHVSARTPPTCIVHGEKDTLTPLSGVQRYCAALQGFGRACDLHVYPGLGHLLTRNLANQESGYDPDPVARADGIEKQHQFLKRLGFVP